jgi:hypothetical protein
MIRAFLVTGVVVTLTVAVASCKQSEDERGAGVTQEVEAPSNADDAGRLGRDVSAKSVWPPPADGIRSSETVRTKLIAAGVGKETPALGKHHVLAMSYATYDRDGRVMKHVPLMVQAVDLAPATWQAVLLTMRRGEVRRAWIEMPGGDVTIMDFEIRSFSRIGPDGKAVSVD